MNKCSDVSRYDACGHCSPSSICSIHYVNGNYLYVSCQPLSVQLPELEVVPNSSVESDSENEVISIGNASSNVIKESPISINPLGCEHSQLYREIGLNLVQESLAFGNEFCDGPPEIEIEKDAGTLVLGYILILDYKQAPGSYTLSLC